MISDLLGCIPDVVIPGIEACLCRIDEVKCIPPSPRIIETLIEYSWNDPDAYRCILEQLHSKGYLWDEWACVAAAKVGDVEILKYLHENGCPWDHRVMMAASEKGHLECLRYLHENSCPTSGGIIRMAIEGSSRDPPRYLECVKYLHKAGYRWDEWCCITAARVRNVEILRYLHENECSLSYRVTTIAYEVRSIECLEYLYNAGCEWEDSVYEIMLANRTVYPFIDDREVKIVHTTPSNMKQSQYTCLIL